MRHLKRFSAWTDKHPIASIILGMFVLWLIALTLLPADPPYLNHAAQSSKSAT